MWLYTLSLLLATHWSAVVIFAQELNIESRYLNTLLQPGSQGNLTEWDQQQLTILFSDLSFQSNSLKIGNLYYSMFCPAPSAPYMSTLIGFVPADQEVYDAVVCQVKNQQLFNFTNNTGTAAPGSISRRRLLQLDLILQSADPNLPCDINSYFGGNAGGVCGGGNNPNAADQINFLKQLGGFADGQNMWNQAAYQGFSQQDFINYGVTSVLKQQTSINTALEGQASNLQSQIKLLTTATQNQFAWVDGQLQNTLQDVAQVSSQLVSYTDQAVAKLANKTVTAISDLAGHVTAAFGNQSINDQKYEQALQVIRLSVANLAAALTSLTLETVYADALATKVWNNIAVMERKGQVPFTSDVPAYTGTPPLSGGIGAMPLGQRQAVVDVITLNFVNQSASQVSHSYTITLLCDNFNMTMIKDPSYKDFLQLIGPFGCATNASSPADIVNRCICWVQITHKMCTPGGSFTSWLDVTTLDDRTAYTLSPSLCQSNVAPVAGPWDGRLIDNINVFNAFLSDLCFMTPVVTQNYMLMVSQRLGRRIISPDQDPLICNIDFSVLFGTQYENVNLPFAIYTDWVLTYKAFQLDVTVFRKLLQGGLPHYVTYRYNPFYIMPDGTYGRCYTAYLTGVSPITVPVYQLSPLPIVSSVTINAYATPPVCGDGGCVFPPTVSHQTTSTVSPNINALALLPQAGDLVFGELSPLMSSIYDADRRLTSVATAAPAREVTYNYFMQPVPEGFNVLTDSPPPTWTLDQFMAYNTFAPQHDRAVISISTTQMPYFGGRPQPAPAQRKQWLASTLDNFNIGSQTNMRAGSLVFQPSGHWQVTALVQTVVGEVVQTVFTGCPSFYFQVYSTNVVNLVVTNVQPVAIEVQLDITQSSPFCPVPGSQKLSLASKQQFVQLVPPCGNITAQVYTIGPNNVLTACQTSPIGVNVNPSLVTSISPFTMIGGENTTVISDQVVQLANGVANAAASLISVMGSTLLLAFRDPNITLADFTVVVNNTIQQTIDGIVAQANAVTLANTNIDKLLQPLQDQFANGQANVTTLVQAQGAQITQLGAQDDAFNATVQQIKNDTAQVNATVARLDAAIAKLIQDLQTTAANSATDCNTLSFFASIWCQLKQTFYWIILGVVGLILVVCLVPVCLPQIFSAVSKTQQGIEQANVEADMQKLRTQAANDQKHRLIEKEQERVQREDYSNVDQTSNAGSEGKDSLSVQGRATMVQMTNPVSNLLPDTIRRALPTRTRADYHMI